MRTPPGSPPAHSSPLAWGLLILALAAPGAAREYGKPLFVWTDEQGMARYTTHPGDVPAAWSHTLREVHRIQEVVVPGAVQYALPEGAGGSGGPLSEPGAASAEPGGSSVATEAASAQTALDREIAALRARIARDEEILKNLISDPEAAPELSASSNLASIAERLPEQQDELRALIAERDARRGGQP